MVHIYINAHIRTRIYGSFYVVLYNFCRRPLYFNTCRRDVQRARWNSPVRTPCMTVARVDDSINCVSCVTVRSAIMNHVITWLAVSVIIIVTRSKVGELLFLKQMNETSSPDWLFGFRLLGLFPWKWFTCRILKISK